MYEGRLSQLMMIIQFCNFYKDIVYFTVNITAWLSVIITILSAITIKNWLSYYKLYLYAYTGYTFDVSKGLDGKLQVEHYR